jgi:hypothetical protein
MSGHLKGGHPTGVYLLGVKAYKRASYGHVPLRYEAHRRASHRGVCLMHEAHRRAPHRHASYRRVPLDFWPRSCSDAKIAAEVAPPNQVDLVESNTFPIAIVDAQAPSYVPQIVMSSQGIA